MILIEYDRGLNISDRSPCNLSESSTVENKKNALIERGQNLGGSSLSTNFSCTKQSLQEIDYQFPPFFWKKLESEFMP